MISITDEHYNNRNYLSSKYKITPRITPIIVTLYDVKVTEFEMQKYIEHGLKIVRFRLTKHTIEEKIKLLDHLKRAVKVFCQKYEICDWPVAVSIDLANGCIFTGFLSEEIPENFVILKKDSIIELTSDMKYCFKCDTKRIFMNDPYTLPAIPVGAEIYLDFGEVVMVCVKIVNNKTIKCKVIKEGEINDQQKVCIRGVKHLKPALSKRDLEDIEFAKTYKCDIIIINTVRNPLLIEKLKALFKDSHIPLFLSVICDQEGLDNVKEIIAVSDGLVLAREYLACSIEKPGQLLKIQLQVGALCKMQEKHFFVSGHILQESLLIGHLVESDISDVTMALKQGAGLFLRSYSNECNMNQIYTLINNICLDEDPILMKTQHFSDIPCKIPLNAAETCIQASILTAKLVNAKVIIVPTVTGQTVMQLSNICENIFIVAVSKSPVVARKLQLFRGVIALPYDDNTAAFWESEKHPRIKFGAAYAFKFEILKYRCPFVALRKATSCSSYSDQVDVWSLTEKEHVRLQIKLKQSLQGR
ncbi:unnamed protein product [Arctia plantaginis]|uniref:Pyruvate kinase n=1 Tax=Arctia plantaginis TaxID=874455 RepID=A0A8S1B5F5_ARCPL|nr:unnamed protein product [Arctia plantaginis]